MALLLFSSKCLADIQKSFCHTLNCMYFSPTLSSVYFKETLTALCAQHCNTTLKGYCNPHCLFQEHAKHPRELELTSAGLRPRCNLLTLEHCGAGEWCVHRNVTQQKLYWWALKLTHARIPCFRIWISTGEYFISRMWTGVSNCWVRPAARWPEKLSASHELWKCSSSDRASIFEHAQSNWQVIYSLIIIF